MNPFLPEKLGPKIDNRSSAKMNFQREAVIVRVQVLNIALQNTRNFVESLNSVVQARENASHNLGHLSSLPVGSDGIFVTPYTKMLNQFELNKKIEAHLEPTAPVDLANLASKPSDGLSILDMPVLPLGEEFIAQARQNVEDARISV